MERKLLVTVDGSVYSANTLRYLSRLFEDLDQVFLHLLCVVPCTLSAAGRDWLDDLELMSSMSPASRKQYAAARRYMNEAVMQLGRRGISPQQITTQVQLSRTGVADDILTVARQGLYDALIIGRRGLTRLEEMVMGSVSERILKKCTDVPIWVVDGQVNSRRFLLPVDGSFHSLKAADHLGFILKDNPYAEVTLFHSESMFSHKQTLDPEQCRQLFGNACDFLLDNRPDSHFHGPEQLLLNSGFPAEKIRRLTTSKGVHPSRQIIRQALIDDFGTIVMGRRGGEEKKGFLGSVSAKVMAMAADVSVWLVG
ncbi:MAG: universal stress protein [Desulfobacterales bacterium]|nr:universal stress protein [Desulfobacterales bacterium]